MTGHFTYPGEMPVDPNGLTLCLELALAFGTPNMMRQMLPKGGRPGMVLITKAAGPFGDVDGQMVMSLGHLSALAGALAEFRNSLPTGPRDQFDANRTKAARLFRQRMPPEGSGWR